MAFDEGLAEVMRSDLAVMTGIEEKRMFGGLCFLLSGNMLCGVHKGGGMFRVGKKNQEQALTIKGATPLSFTGRKMGGLIDVTDDLLADDTRRAKCLEHALNFVAALPAK